MRILSLLAIASVSLGFACSSNDSAPPGGGGQTSSATSAAQTGSGAVTTNGATSTTTAGTGASGVTSTTTATSAGSTGSGGGGPPTAAALLAKLANCNQVSNGKYKTDSDSPQATVAICGLTGAVFWQADMDVDCDGKTTQQCNIDADPDYQNQTSATDSNGDPLDAANLPFVVIPLPSATFSYKTAGLSLGSVVAVIYQGQVEYGVFGDEGPKDIIGESSYAMAKSLGIDPNPSTGGVDSGVTYIAFTGDSGVLKKIEDHTEATEVGQTLAAELINAN